MWPNSVCVRAEKLPPHRRVEEQVVDLDRRAHRAAARRTSPARPPATSISAPPWLSAVRLRNTSRLTSAIEASASPRKPSVPTRNRSSASASLLVAWLATASGNSSAGMPQPLSTTRIISSPPCCDGHVDARGAGIDGVFHQLLDHAGRPLDDLAGGDLVDQGLGELTDGRQDRD